MFEAFWVSWLAVALAEIGDRSMFIALILGMRYAKPWAIFAGMSVGLLSNMALSALVGVWLFSWFEGSWHQWVMGAVFLLMAVWILIPEQEEAAEKPISGRSAFLASAIAFFVSEMADKTQLAVVALAGSYQLYWPVVFGATLGLLVVSAPALWLGHKFAARLPIKPLKWFGALLFVLFGLIAFSQAAELI